MAATVDVRAATEADVDAIVALVNAAFAVERAFLDRDRTSPSEILALLGKGTFLVLDDDRGALVASVYLERRGERAYLGMLSIQPSRQGTGLGRAMMVASEAHARRWNCTAIDIRIVNLRRELPPFYRALGFSESGRTDIVEDPFTREPYHFILMTKGLALSA
jgi:GNAT superfamily N-acetyltransferase